MELLNGVKIEGRTNLWSEIDSLCVGDEKYLLMENDYWGDETFLIVIKLPKEIQTKELKNGKTVIWIPEEYEICETYDDIKTVLIDEEILSGNCE